jgi:RNA polymerase sigma-70 factor (ECF subfamily)
MAPRDEIAELWRVARDAWPGFSVGEERFREFVRARTQAEPPRAADLYLACACLDGDAAALRAFDSLLVEVAGYLRHLATDEHVFADAQQNVRQVLLPRGDRPPALAEYNGRGKLGGWLRIILTRELSRLRALERRERPLDPSIAAVKADVTDDPETAYLKAHYQDEFKRAFADAMSGLADDDRRLLRYAVLERLSIDEIARLEHIHRATAARHVAQARERLAETTRAALESRLRVAPEQLSSILRLVPSQIDLSVRRLLEG